MLAHRITLVAMHAGALSYRTDLSDEELVVRVIPKQADEFTCSSCFLVHHRSRLADAGAMICTDCA